MKTMTQCIVSRPLPYAAIVSIIALCMGITSVANARLDVAITVTTTSQQTFDGFGVCVSNTIGEFLPSGGRDDKPGSFSEQVYNSLFKTGDANSLSLTFLRIPLLAGSYKNTATATYDFATSVEKFGEGDVIRAARKRNSNLKLLLTAFTPPGYMKSNNSGNSGGGFTFDPDDLTINNRLKTTEYNNYAALLKRYCDDFTTQFGFYPYALGIQNEPDVNAPYDSCLFTSDQFVSLLTATRNAFSWSYPTKLWGPELTKASNVAYIQKVANAGLLNAAATHTYNGNAGDIPDSARNNLKLNMTEFSYTDSTDLPTIAANSINRFCKDANRGKVVSWFHWSAVGVNFNNPDNPIKIGEHLLLATAVSNANSVYKTVDTSNGQGLTANLRNNSLYPADGSQYSSPYKKEFNSFQPTSLYYAFRRLTQSVTPGSVSKLTNVSPNYYTNSGQDDVYSAAFKRADGKLCLVVANKSTGTSYNATIKFDELASTGTKYFNTYYTSANGSTPVNDSTWSTGFTNGQATTTLYPRAVYVFVQQ